MSLVVRVVKGLKFSYTVVINDFRNDGDFSGRWTRFEEYDYYSAVRMSIFFGFVEGKKDIRTTADLYKAFEV